ncbi:hypothetical protein [Saprospira grandis]|uniref:hypothetical protein n=1 Tax=Saprospira grandis TaxID=1008 RepID=UPI0022DE2839|nr:hypothetical protein [Saprospira grandis]WBM74065.1 hypothetical protein OP864_13840 [Saprospira grandis]
MKAHPKYNLLLIFIVALLGACTTAQPEKETTTAYDLKPYEEPSHSRFIENVISLDTLRTLVGLDNQAEKMQELKKTILAQGRLNQWYYIENEDSLYNNFYLNYLGDLISLQEDTLSFFSEITINSRTRLVVRMYSTLEIFKNKEYVGRYSFYGIDIVPKGIKNKSVLLYRNFEDCPNKMSYIDFSSGIPQGDIFIPCRDNEGDFFSIEQGL